MKDIKLERVRQVAKWIIFKGIADNQKDLAIEMGYNPTVLSAILTGHTPLSTRFIKNLCAMHSDIDLEWVMGLRDEPRTPLHGPGNGGSDSRPATASRGDCPFYSDLPVSGGRVEQFTQDAAPTDYVHIPGVDAQYFFPVVGYSMEPFICPGDIVGVREVGSSETLFPDKVYMLVTSDNERMIKHIYPCQDAPDCIELRSDNPDYPPTRIPRSSVIHIFRVVYAGRRM